MNILHELNELDKRGVLTDWVRCGLLPYHIVLLRDIYQAYDAKVRSGVPKTDAKVRIAEDFRVSEWRVEKALRMFHPADKKIMQGNKVIYLHG